MKTHPRSFWLPLHWTLFALALLGVTLRSAPTDTPRSFNLPADRAESALKAFSVQSGQEVLFTTDTVDNVRTQAVRGRYTPREAIELMLVRSGLVATQDEKTGAWRVKRNGAQPAGGGARPSARGSGGSLSGRVSNAATRVYLEGAAVEIRTLGRRALTDAGGSYLFPDVPAGEHEVSVTYTGLDAARAPVRVNEGGEARRDFELTSGVYLLEAFTVSGEREGNAVSITKQRNADNVVNIVAMDTYGNVADGNIGNFMQRLPGIGAIIENGDIVGFGVRGTPSELNAVNIDGVRSSNAYGGANPQGDRAVVVDSIPSDFIKEIELTKALTPDQAADSIGGATNLVTKSALDFKGSVLTYRAGLNQNTYRRDDHHFKPTGSLSYLTRVGPEQDIGVAFSAGFAQTENSRDRVQMARGQPDGRNTVARTLNDQAVRSRGGMNLKLNVRPAGGWDLQGGVQYTYFSFQQVRTDWNIGSSNTNVADYTRVSRTEIEGGAAPRTTANTAAGIAPGFTDDFTELLHANFTNTEGGTARHGRSYKYDFAARRNFAGAQRLSLQASYNPSEYDFIFQFVAARRNGRIGVAVDTRTNRDRPRYVQTYGPSIGFGASLDGYTALRAVNHEHSEEEVANVQLDYEKKLRLGGISLEFKTGANWRQQHRILDVFQPRWNYVGPDGVAGTADDNFAPFRRAEPG
jgi:hypothetical protein